MRHFVKALALTVLVAFSTTGAGAAPSNPLLQSTMKTLAKDVDETVAPTRFSDPSDVPDAVILNAVTRARTAAYALTLVKDRRAGEMEPANVRGLPPSQRDAKLTEFAGHLTRAVDKLTQCEQTLLAEAAKPSEQRSFRTLKTRLVELDQIMKDAHRIFKP